MSGDQTISEEDPQADVEGGSDGRFAREHALRLAAERELAELQAQKRHLERRAINARHTLAYGLGKALIDARSLKGLVALPSRLKQLRLRQKAKRKLRVPDTVPDNLARRMHAVDKTLLLARKDGVVAARKWADARAERDVRGRALTELALFALDGSLSAAADIGLDAARAAPSEPRLLALIARLEERGEVSAPAGIAAAIQGAQHLSPPQRVWFERLAEDAHAISDADRGKMAIADRLDAGTRIGPVEEIVFLTPDRWRVCPRLLAAEGAARAAGLQTRHAVSDAVLAGFAAHIIPDSLEFAEQSLAQASAANFTVIDIANCTPAICGNTDSEAARAESLRFVRLAERANVLISRGPAAARLIADLGGQSIAVDDGWMLSDSFTEEDVTVVRAEFGIGKGERVLAACLDFGTEDDLEKLIDAFGELAEGGHFDRLAILGEGPAMPGLDQLILARALDEQVTFVGMPGFARWPALFGACSTIVFPASHEATLGSQIPMGMPLASNLGMTPICSEPAWRSRTSNAIRHLPLGSDWASSIVQKPQDSEVIGVEPSPDALSELYHSFGGE